MSLHDGKRLTHEELQQWLNRPAPPKRIRERCAHDVELLLVVDDVLDEAGNITKENPSVYGCTECGAEWSVP